MNKIPREIRVAYLAEIVYRKLQEGKNIPINRKRRKKLLKELATEKLLNSLTGFMVDDVIVRKYEKH